MHGGAPTRHFLGYHRASALALARAGQSPVPAASAPVALVSALHPSLRLATRLLEAAVALVVAAYLLLGAGLLTLRYAVLPQAQQFVPWLEQASSRALGLPVHIGSVQARWHGLLPVLSIHDLVIDDGHGHPALRLDSVQAMPSWKSLPRMQLSFEQLAIRGADLRITRVDADHIDIGGIALNLRGGAQSGSTRFADWLFSQDQILVQDSRVTWVDRMHAAPPLRLRDVSIDLRNTLLRHRLALQALPPQELGATLQLRADMHQSLFDIHPGDFAAWHGTLWVDMPRVDIDALGQWLQLPAHLHGGDGAIRAWLQVGRGYSAQQLTLVAALGPLSAQLRPDLPALRLRALSGSLLWQRLVDGQQLQLSNLRLLTDNGALLAPSRLAWREQRPPGKAPQGSAACDGLDLAALDQLAQALPLPAAWRARLQLLQPRGSIAQASLSWSAASARQLPQRYTLQARFAGLGWNSPAPPPAPEADPLAQQRAQAALPAAWPGVQGLDGSIDANQDAGSAELRMQPGAVALPTVFDAASLPLRKLQARLSWTRAANGAWDLQASHIQLQTPDASGTVDLRYTTQAGTPGLLDLSAHLDHVDARAVPAYLPRAVDPGTRDYLRSAIAGGSASRVRVLVQGPLAAFPFEQPGSGVFEVDAHIQDGVFNPAPRHLLGRGRQAQSSEVAGNALWPVFRDLSGDFRFTARGMSARALRARADGIELSAGQLELADYAHAVVQAQGLLQGQAGDALRYLRDSPLDQALGHSLSRASASGPLRGQLRLSLPLQQLEKARVQGRLQFLDDRLRYLPWLPPMVGTRGTLDFSEHGFQLQLDARDFAGAPLQLRGTQDRSGALRIDAQGQAHAAALRALPAWQAWQPLLRQMHGSAPFSLQIRSAATGQPLRISLRSSLQGMALALPAPLAKAASGSAPLRLDVQQTGAGAQDIELALGDGLRLRGSLRAASGAGAPHWRQLGIALGARAALPHPAAGVQANVALDSLDVDTWRQLLEPPAVAGGGASAAALPADWLPSALALDVASLTLDGRRFDHVVLGATRQDSLWQANLRSDQLDGLIDWRMGAGGAPGSIHARLSRLWLPRSADPDVEQLLDAQPLRSLPAIDLQASDVDIHGHRFDSLQLRAVNIGNGSARRWQLDHVRLRSRDAVLDASGDWTPRAGGARHRMALGFRLEVADAGALLARLGKPGLLKGGKGTLKGTLSWLGSPLALDYPTLSGQFALQLGQGRFLKADPGISKLLGVLSLQSLPRRLMFNFSDVFSSGFAFDKVTADVQVHDGRARTNNFRMRGLSATVFIDGSADLARETQDLYVVVVPDINAGSASLAYALINPAIGLGTFIAQLIAREPLMKALTYGYHITGTWTHPDVAPQHEPHAPPTAAARPGSLPARPSTLRTPP